MILSNILETPSKWSNQSTEVTEIELCPTDTEYKVVKEYLSGKPLLNLQRITRVQNAYLYHRYMIRKLEYETLNLKCSEMNLLHATDANKIPSIIKDNLDRRLANRVKFGRGVSFSPNAIYANEQCCRLNGRNRAMIVAYVLVGKTTPGTFLTKIPPKGFDTTVGNYYNVYVKYNDDEFYPAYVAYYHL